MISEQLQLSLSQRTVLVTTDVVRAMLGVDAETVVEKVDNGELQWVFDVSVRGRTVRELRFWAREVVTPECRRLDPGQAVQHILGGGRERWRGTEVEQLFLTSRASVMRWHRAGDLPGETVGRTLWVSRRSLEQFLNARLCGTVAETEDAGFAEPSGLQE